MSLNVKLLRQVKQKILSEPRQFMMGWYFTKEGEQIVLTDLPRRTIPNCHTAACIAGWTVACANGYSPSKARDKVMSVGDEARMFLGIDITNGLFVVSGWPKKYQDAWYRAKTHKARAQVAARRIEAFIKEHREQEAH
jgi:hypothetical protein